MPFVSVNNPTTAGSGAGVPSSSTHQTPKPTRRRKSHGAQEDTPTAPAPTSRARSSSPTSGRGAQLKNWACSRCGWRYTQSGDIRAHAQRLKDHDITVDHVVWVGRPEDTPSYYKPGDPIENNPVYRGRLQGVVYKRDEPNGPQAGRVRGG
ncbi:hypothetical protein DFH27DRAFT_385964 [Peziza echinospora]|nr:hypothetical protein DFH27DRAFT_385964 [Peziza echinospora]